MLLHNPFESVSTNGVDAIVLEVITRSDTPYTLSQIFQLQRGTASRTSLRSSLNRFVQHGLISESQFGKTFTYQLNRNHLLYAPLMQIASAKERFFELLRSEVGSWPVQPRTVMVFGSAARGEMTLDSDIDILIVAPDDWEDAEQYAGHLAREASNWTGNDVRHLFYHEQEIADEPIFRSIEKDGISVVGAWGWLKTKLRQIRRAA